jgi:hypothetical protein
VLISAPDIRRSSTVASRQKRCTAVPLQHTAVPLQYTAVPLAFTECRECLAFASSTGGRFLVAWRRPRHSSRSVLPLLPSMHERHAHVFRQDLSRSEQDQECQCHDKAAHVAMHGRLLIGPCMEAYGPQQPTAPHSQGYHPGQSGHACGCHACGYRAYCRAPVNYLKKRRGVATSTAMHVQSIAGTDCTVQAACVQSRLESIHRNRKANKPCLL